MANTSPPKSRGNKGISSSNQSNHTTPAHNRKPIIYKMTTCIFLFYESLNVILNIGYMAYRMTTHAHNASIVIRSRRYLICFSAIPRPFHQAKQAMHNVMQQQNAWNQMLSASDVNV